MTTRHKEEETNQQFKTAAFWSVKDITISKPVVHSFDGSVHAHVEKIIDIINSSKQSNGNKLHLQFEFKCGKKYSQVWFKTDYKTYFSSSKPVFELRIQHLASCPDETATETLRDIIHIAHQTEMNLITLTDASTIYFLNDVHEDENCGISLKTFYILMKGYSWYNSFGFHSTDYENELLHNSQFPPMKLVDFLTLTFSKKNQLRITTSEEFIDLLYTLFPEWEQDRTLIVSDAITRLRKNQYHIPLIKTCEDQLAMALTDLSDFAAKVIKYNNSLQMIIHPIENPAFRSKNRSKTRSKTRSKNRSKNRRNGTEHRKRSNRKRSTKRK